MGRGINLNCSVEQFEKNMRKIAARRSEYDRLCGGYEILDASLVDKYLSNARYILTGHEGEPVTPRPRPAAPPADPSGAVIYSRHFPRPPDMPKNMGAANENLRRMTYADCNITYDVRRIRN